MKAFKIVFISLIVLLMYGLFRYNTYKNFKNSSFKVALRSLPSKIDPIFNEVNIYHYINIQLFYPLFELSDNNQLSSHFLNLTNTMLLDSSSKNFQICLNDVTFSDGTEITADKLENAINRIHLKNPELPKLIDITSSGKCTRIVLSESDPKYFYKLTTIDTTILKHEINDKTIIPIGLGPFKIRNFSKNQILLTRQTSNSLLHNEISTVEFIRISTPEEGLAEQIHDWNHVWQHLGDLAPIPNQVKTSSKIIRQNLLRSLMLVVHLSNERNRKYFASCFNRNSYIKNLNLNLEPTKGYLPNGLAGSNVSFDKIVTSWDLSKDNCRLNPKLKPVKFFIFYESLFPLVANFLSENQKLIPFKVELELISVEEAIHKLFSNDDFIMPTLADTMKASASGFFTPFIGKSNIAFSHFNSIKTLISKASMVGSQDSIEKLYSKAHFLLLNSGFIIPLGQVKSTFYYPKFIKKIDSIDPANGFPLINHIEVSDD